MWFSSVLCTIFTEDDANRRMDSLSDILDRLEEYECRDVEVVIEPPLNAVAEVTDEASENEDGDDVNRLSSNQLVAPATLQCPHQLSDRSNESDDETAATMIKKENVQLELR